MYSQILEKIGLTSSEAKAYEATVVLGQATPAEIAKKAGITRVNAYQVLPKLEKLKLVLQEQDTKQVKYSPGNPDRLLELLDQQEKDLSIAKELFRKVAKQLEPRVNLKQGKPIIRYFNGFEGVKESYMSILENTKDKIQYGIVNRSDDPEFTNWIDDVFIKERVRRNISVKIIITNKESGRRLIERSKEEKREVKIVDIPDFPSGTYILVFGERVLFISRPRDLTHNIGIIIDHPSVAKDIKALFDLLWE